MPYSSSVSDLGWICRACHWRSVRWVSCRIRKDGTIFARDAYLNLIVAARNCVRISASFEACVVRDRNKRVRVNT